MEDSNPYLEIPDPYEGYKKSIEEQFVKNPGLRDFGKKCYDCLVSTKEGVEFYDALKNTFLLQGQMFNPYADNSRESAFYWMAIREFIISLGDKAEQYQLLITK